MNDRENGLPEMRVIHRALKSAGQDVQSTPMTFLAFASVNPRDYTIRHVREEPTM